jgi:arylsulfatase A-like enzyme
MKTIITPIKPVFKKAGIRTMTLFTVVLIIITIGCSYSRPKPGFNIVLISLDTLRADHVGAYGYNRYTTPFIDELAKNAILFENAFAHSPNTAISHATMLTSLQPMVHEVSPEYILGEEFETLAEYFKKNGYKTGGFTTHGSWLDRRMGFAQGFDDFYSDFLSAPEINKYVFEFLEKNAKDRFFLFVHYYDIHSDYEKLPYDTGTEYDRKFCKDYKGDFTGCKNNFCASTYLEKVNSKGWTIPGEDLEYITALYDGGIAYTDFHVNCLFNRLRELGLFESSLIIITSDHGEEFMEHGRVLHFQLYNEVMHVPLIIKIPGEKEYASIKSLVGVIDIMPTILDMAGIKHKNLQGKSALPLINSEKEENRFVFATLCGLGPGWESDIFFRNKDNSFFTRDKFTIFELYDVQMDPDEKINIANAKEKKIKKRELLQKAIAYYQAQKKEKKKFKHKKRKTVFKKEETDRLKSLGYIN